MTKYFFIILAALLFHITTNASELDQENYDFEAELRLLEESQMQAVEELTQSESKTEVLQDSVSQRSAAALKEASIQPVSPLPKTEQKTRRVRSR